MRKISCSVIVMILDGKKVADNIQKDLKKEIDRLKEKPKLVIVTVGDNPASKSYTIIKQKACKKVGINCVLRRLPEKTSENELMRIIEALNKDKKVHAMIVQLPLPKHVDEIKINKKINPLKDVDGFSPENMGKLLLGNEEMAPATPKGIVRLMEEYKIPLEGKNVVIVNRSNIVGKPLSLLLIYRNATVEICHTKTKDLKEHTKRADILIVAAGKPKLITTDFVNKNSIIIDVGVNRVDEKLCGDVDFENVKDIVSYITPVPGGVGPMTVAMLLENTLKAYKKQLKGYL